MSFRITRLLWATGFAGLGIFAAVNGFRSLHGTEAAPQPSPLLQKITALGDLHAVRYTYRDIHDFTSHEEPNAFFAALPGGASLVNAATRNSATLSFLATVEAGVDLTHAKVEKSATGVVVVVPMPKVYPTQVTAEVNDVHRGLFWRDNSIAVSAIEDAKQRLRETSLQQGILAAAKENVAKRIASLASGLTSTPVAVSFRSDFS